MKRNQMSMGLRMMLEKAPCDPVSAFNAALLLEEERKAPKAVQYFCLRAAEDGYVPAMLKLASMYISGYYDHGNSGSEGIVQDIQSGVSWIQRGADTGDSTALYMLAHCYYEGVGVRQSSVEGRYLMDHVTFPSYSFNPYEQTETLIFGVSSCAIRAYLCSRKRSMPRSLAG